MNKEEFLKAIMGLPKIETDNPISTMTSINIDDLMSAIDRLNKVPNYNDLLKENQELKKQLEEANKKLYLCTPEIPQNVHGKYVSYVDLVFENQELKKQLENNSKINVADHKYASECEDKVIVLETQQKEFIKYLQDMLDYENDIFSVVRVKDVLQKYKEIIGVSDE